MGTGRELKSNFILSIYIFTKNEDGSLEQISEVTEKTSAAGFYRDYWEARSMGEKLNIEVVDKKPETFQFNQLYARRDRKRAWVFLLEE